MDQNRILILSYYAGMPGACQAEWIDDKIYSLAETGKEMLLISASCAVTTPGEIEHVRAPSLSPHDFKDELIRIKGYGKKVPFTTYLYLPIVYTIGLVVDLLQSVLTKGVGEGRWAWSITASIVGLLQAMKFRPEVILSTGGPASAHLAGVLIAKVFNIPLVVELQDPLSGGDIGRNAQARGWLYKVEDFIVRNSVKVAYVTNEAAKFATSQFKADNIVGIYPGARDFRVKPTVLEKNQAGTVKLKLIHLGSLYATRTFNSIIPAIDKLIASGRIREEEVKLINLGHVAPEIREIIEKKSYVEIFAPVDRREALKRAAGCDVTLLIQNLDERSKVTIPYKTYDYLNIGNNVLGLLNSEELTTLLEEHGHRAVDLRDIDRITQHLEEILRGVEAGEELRVSAIDPVKQAIELVTV